MKYKYLQDPCPRCNHRTLGHPEKRGSSNKRTCYCHTCGKRAGYIEYQTVDGAVEHKVYAIGGVHEPTKLMAFRLPLRLSDTSKWEVVDALDAWRSR